jgi:serine-type D-Ala-D-Ala carboxypeptidase (penicillin-binding protein 5/6)
VRNRSVSLPLLAAIAVVEVVAIVVALGAFRYTRPLPAVDVALMAPVAVQAPAATVGLAWPEAGQAAFAIEGFGPASTFGTQDPVPIASITKVMTAMVILDEHPLALGESGPEIEITFAHEEAFVAAILNDESAVPVLAGENYSQMEMLQGVLIASGNNLARILAQWDSGSEVAFVAKMNAMAAEIGLANTRFTDASGLDAGNTSTAADLLRLGEIAMADPVFASIVAMDEVELPAAGVLASTNILLGSGGIMGIKTGETDEAGACLLIAARIPTVAGERLVVGAVLGQPTRQGVFDASRELVASAGGQVVIADITNEGGSSVAYGEPIAVVVTEWEAAAFVFADGALSVAARAGTELTVETVIDDIEGGASGGDVVGVLRVTSGETIKEVPLVLASDLPGPDWRWRLLRN